VPIEARAARVEFDGKPAILFHVRDITERRSAETALHSSEMLFRSVWENSVDGMRLTDENGIIVAVNERVLPARRPEAGGIGRQAVHDHLRRFRGLGKKCWRTIADISMKHTVQRQGRTHQPVARWTRDHF
jgi:hypothetical protein